jgi:hypothetical protein
MRAINDFQILTSKTSSLEDKAIAARSLSAYSVEMAVFKTIAIGSSYMLGSLAYNMMGIDETDEENEKRLNNLIKGQATGAVTDVLSPVPVLDPYIQDAAAITLDKVQQAMDVDKDDVLSLYESNRNGLDYLGTLGVTAKRAQDLYDISNLSATGKYKDNYGREMTISDENAEALQPFIGLSVLSNIGLAPSEVGSIVRYAQKAAKRDAKAVSEKEHKAKEYKEEKVKEIKLKKGEFGYQKPSETFGGKGFGSKTFGGKGFGSKTFGGK